MITINDHQEHLPFLEKMASFLVIVISCLSLICLAHCKSDLRKNLHYFEVLHSSQFGHNIVKRGAQPSDHPFNKIREVNFKALGRDFRLILSPKKGLLHPKFKAVEVDDDNVERPVRIDHETFFDGRVFGETKSRATVHLEPEGMITAKIETPEETYHIEPSWRHIADSEPETMIAYKESDINFR